MKTSKQMNCFGVLQRFQPEIFVKPHLGAFFMYGRLKFKIPLQNVHGGYGCLIFILNGYHYLIQMVGSEP